jgi:hypothetical protein
MRKPGPSIMLAIGLPSRLAHEDDDEPPQDEDNLSREQDHFGDDGPPDTLQLLYDRLRARDEPTSHAAMSLAKCLQQMCHHAARRDQRGLHYWFKQARDVKNHIDGTDRDEEDDNGQQ